MFTSLRVPDPVPLTGVQLENTREIKFCCNPDNIDMRYPYGSCMVYVWPVRIPYIYRMDDVRYMPCWNHTVKTMQLPHGNYTVYVLLRPYGYFHSFTVRYSCGFCTVNMWLTGTVSTVHKPYIYRRTHDIWCWILELVGHFVTKQVLSAENGIIGISE